MKDTNTTYTAVCNPLEGYDFSFSGCHAAEIGAYVIGILIFAVLCALIYGYAEKGREWRDLRDNILYPVCFSVPLLLMGLSMTLRTRRVRRIMTEGEAVGGEITSYSRVRVGRRSMSQKPNYTLLHVKFYHGGAERECTVPVGHRLPGKALASPECTVYILGNRVFVTDFALRKKGGPETVFEEK